MIEKLKRAAEFLGYELTTQFGGEYFETKTEIIDINDFNPHEETGRHWLVEMVNKLTLIQFNEYLYKMQVTYKEGKLAKEDFDFWKWFWTAPSKLCFEKIMEVIG